ncbi:twinkle protein [Marchantia polymorpha subsp. ruderalis]|uniref:SF4 helicase domain-containing protein n=2 Tax=Marchantia polymorpha TaxID=3197 RepID=A0AAF6BYZ9_MARPO|nr:hypothetical protein MARPO_0003s0305 [Marchantia polymorpha]BBN17233.1 hypothetical protein Mp_7g12970 [Marchantia polymorpha subsp. ruderalis]PTQ49470.1 hypothetical protein MARPO_0003s0305 [Marchantia polymorpha]PTQ49471.1 hypothetical protein MARPO_0003s0305 [Marchantia polymorpha]BBN17234.1 hypothetical protein Mp_7g12970 [Marchantia polymorpha subsp. ruderalis]|eukprot:PTQ49468.1 hypothetical protein MARPO_0003s0305 [Marchantia polymorpha]
MVLAGHVRAAGGRIQVTSVWSASTGLARHIWWLPVLPSLCCKPLQLRTCRTVPRRCVEPISQLTRGKRSFYNGCFRTSLSLAIHRSMGAAAMAREREPVPRNNEKTTREQLAKVNIILPSYAPGQYRIVCPECDGGTNREKSLAVGIDDTGLALWICHRGTCGWKGSGPTKVVGTKDEAHTNGTARPTKVAKEMKQNVKPQPITIESLALQPPPIEVVEWFHERGISANTLEKNQVRCINTTGDVVIAFPYTREGDIVNCKFRSVDKKFWQVKGAEKVLYGLDDIKNSKEIIIVEGEIDKLTLYEAGYTNCVSVPDGAPPKVSTDTNVSRVTSDGAVPKGSTIATQDKKYEYLYNCREYFTNATRIVLATDSDEPGLALAEELARRLGRERCWRVKWPKREGEAAVCKDANEVLQYLGPEAVRNVIETSELYPIRGLFQFSQFFKEIDDYYHLRMGDERGVSTGWSGLDSIYRVVPGELTVVTGVPNSGKSEWIDALLCNLSRDYNWTFALCSMENKVREHARKLLEKHLKKPFFDAPYANSISRMDKGAFERGKSWLNQNFFLIRCEDDELPSVDWVLDLAKAAVLRHGVRGLVIDPYNELDHQRPSSQTETEYVSQMLTRVKRFAQHHDCHVWFVAHPKQLQVWRGEAPGLYDISGSAHFINKCDNGLVIHRNRDPDAGPLDQVQVLVRKVRNKAAGTIGEATLRYDRATGEYADVI